MLKDELNQLKEFAKLYSRRAIQEMKQETDSVLQILLKQAKDSKSKESDTANEKLNLQK